MALFIDYEKNEMEIIVPNSEASINAQHKGIADRTVGSYYMSEKKDECIKFFNNFNCNIFVDIQACLINSKKIYDRLEEYNLKMHFKQNLYPQKAAIDTLEWMLNTSKDIFYPFPTPGINEKNKYLKFDNSNDLVELIKTLVLGDLFSIIIKKIGEDGYILYVRESPEFENIISNNGIVKWND